MARKRIGIRWEVCIVGQPRPIVCVRAANIDEAERVAGDDTGLGKGRMVAARAPTYDTRSAGSFARSPARVKRYGKAPPNRRNDMFADVAGVDPEWGT